MKSNTTELKNALEGLNSPWPDQTNNQQTWRQDFWIYWGTGSRRKIMKNEESLKDLWDTIKWNKIHIVGVPEGDEKEKGADIPC